MTSPLICVDASLTLKLVLAEPDSPVARCLWAEWEEQDIDVVSPSVIPSAEEGLRWGMTAYVDILVRE